MRETEMASIGSRETIPQPISANAPNGSKCVMRTGITSPQVSPAMYSAMQRSCAFRRDNTAVILPNASRIKSVMIKHTGLFTREMMAMSARCPRVCRSAPSSRGIMPRIHLRSTMRLCSLSQMMLRASKIFPSRIASERGGRRLHTGFVFRFVDQMTFRVKFHVLHSFLRPCRAKTLSAVP